MSRTRARCGCTDTVLCATCQRLLARSEGRASREAGWSEAQLLACIRQLCQKIGGWQIYHTYCSKRSDPGFPDLVLVRPQTALHSGRLIFAELKREGASPTIPQQRWLEVLKTAVAGVESYLWTPSDLETIITILQRK